MSSARIGGGASPGRLSPVGTPQPGVATPAVPAAALEAHSLPAIRYQSTWPKGWMAAAVPQHVREFHVQVSKAQMALEFLQQLENRLLALAQACRHQRKLPSDAGQGRLRNALQELQAWWAQRYARTLGSLDESLQWSPVHAARKQFGLAGWSWSSLQAEPARDSELVSFCLLGQESAHGTWQAQWGRSQAGSRHALAMALAPLGMQVHGMDVPLLLSVDELQWPIVLQRFMVRGNGKRFPAGQWASPRLEMAPLALRIGTWSAEDAAAVQVLTGALQQVSDRVAQTRAAVQAFHQDAGQSLGDLGARATAAQAFAQAFAQAGQMPAYDWILAVVPAVRAVSRRRVARLLQSRGTLM